MAMKNIEHYLALPYRQTVTLEECTDGSPCYVARVVELPGCESHGTTQADALANLENAKRLYIETMIEDGIEPAARLAAEYARQRA